MHRRIAKKAKDSDMNEKFKRVEDNVVICNNLLIAVRRSLCEGVNRA